MQKIRSGQGDSRKRKLPAAAPRPSGQHSLLPPELGNREAPETCGSCRAPIMVLDVDILFRQLLQLLTQKVMTMKVSPVHILKRY